MVDDVMPTRMHGPAGQLVTREPSRTRDIWAMCGACGEAWRGLSDVRCKRYRLECPHCGLHAGLEIQA